MAPVRLLARPLLAAPFILGGINQLRSSDKMAEQAAPVVERIAGPLKLPTDNAALLVKANGVGMIAGGALLATGKAPRLASLLLAGLLMPTTAAGHPFWAATDPAEKKADLVGFMKNAGLLGGLLIAAADTAGKPGIAYRAGMAKDAVGRAAHTGALEARLVAAQAQNKLPI